MVIPQEVRDAARGGRLDTVRDWLESGTSDANDDDVYGELLFPCCVGFPHTEGHVSVIEYLLSRGADVNLPDGHCSLLHIAAVRQSQSPRKIVELLLGAGSQVNARDNRSDATPLAWVINDLWCFNVDSDRDGETKRLLECCIMLLRAGASIDSIGRLQIDGDLKSVEDFVDRQFEMCPELETNEDLVAFQTIVADLRAAGGSWRQYVLAPPKALLRLRSLIARGRAREVRRLRARTPRPSAWLMSPRVPNEIAWRVLEYWNPRC